jgi:hypothetical protein
VPPSLRICIASFPHLGVGESLIHRLRFLPAFIAGAALFVAVYFFMAYTTPLPHNVIFGGEFLAIFAWRTVRAFWGPIATSRLLRNAQILRTIPVGLIGLSAILVERPAMESVATAVLLFAVLFHFSVARPYTRKAVRQLKEDRPH